MNHKLIATLRLIFLLGSVLFASLSLAPTPSEGIKCNEFCGSVGPIACNYPCRRPE
jgi:hypothetical protein